MTTETIYNKLRGLRELVSGSTRLRRQAIIAHSDGSRKPTVQPLIIPDQAPTSTDIANCARILAAYKLTLDVGMDAKQDDDIWSSIKKSQGAFLSLLNQNDPVLLATYLCNMNRHDATIGTVQGVEEYKKILSNNGYANFIGLQIKDKLVSFAEALGVVPCENPEQGPWGQNLHLDPHTLVQQIGEFLNLDITPPDIDGGLLKVQVGPAFFHERDVNALYTAWRVKEILMQCNETAKVSTICEIGAGSGRVAYWSTKLKPSVYFCVDLPHINAIQSFYLMKSLHDFPISLYGESEPQTGPYIKILPNIAAEEVSEPVDLVLNQDSFPEIGEETVREYLEWIKSLPASLFYSSNHENRPASVAGIQLSVPDLLKTINGYERLWRTPSWIRKGYVEELYRVV